MIAFGYLKLAQFFSKYIYVIVGLIALVVLAIVLPNASSIAERLGFETRASLKAQLAKEEVKADTALQANTNLVQEIEKELLVLVKTEHQETLTKIESVPGIGRKTAMMLIVLTDGFKRFENSGQLSSFCGLTPVIRQSGSSIKGKTRISKVGNAKLRNLLFMCSFTACKCNKACRELYERIVNQGKSKKLALIAVCNKLLKQAFAIAKSGVEYNENYRSKLVLNN